MLVSFVLFSIHLLVGFICSFDVLVFSLCLFANSVYCFYLIYFVCLFVYHVCWKKNCKQTKDSITIRTIRRALGPGSRSHIPVYLNGRVIIMVMSGINTPFQLRKEEDGSFSSVKADPHLSVLSVRPCQLFEASGPVPLCGIFCCFTGSRVVEWVLSPTGEEVWGKMTANSEYNKLLSSGTPPSSLRNHVSTPLLGCEPCKYMCAHSIWSNDLLYFYSVQRTRRITNFYTPFIEEVFDKQASNLSVWSIQLQNQNSVEKSSEACWLVMLRLTFILRQLDQIYNTISTALLQHVGTSLQNNQLN